jgi:cation diffusion facilitator family transporter
LPRRSAQREGGRYDAVARVLWRVLLLNLLVAVAKLVFGYATGAVSIISDGFHSLTDSGSNVMGLIGLRASRKPPDADHPYGHRKFETLAAGGIFVFLLFVVVEVTRAAFDRLTSGLAPEVTVYSFGVMLVTLAINLFVVRYERREGRRLNSEILFADAMHTRSDVLTSCAVLISLASVRLGYPVMDAGRRARHRRIHREDGMADRPGDVRTCSPTGWSWPRTTSGAS